MSDEPLDPFRALLSAGSRAHYVDAAYYDQTYRLRRCDKDYYAAEAASAGGSVLELGCGSGRVTLPIARALDEAGGDGQVIGIDAMPSMLERGTAKLTRERRSVRGRVHFQRGDFTLRGEGAIELGRRFERVFMPFNTLMHCYDHEAQRALFDVVRRHLAPGGELHFDVLLPAPESLGRDPEKVYSIGTTTLPSTGKRYRYRERFEYDPMSQVQIIEMIFVGVDDPTDLHVVPLAHRHFFPQELRLLLQSEGFEILRHDGDFEGDDLDEHAESQVIACRLR